MLYTENLHYPVLTTMTTSSNTRQTCLELKGSPRLAYSGADLRWLVLYAFSATLSLDAAYPLTHIIFDVHIRLVSAVSVTTSLVPIQLYGA